VDIRVGGLLPYPGPGPEYPRGKSFKDTRSTWQFLDSHCIKNSWGRTGLAPEYCMRDSTPGHSGAAGFTHAKDR
jgi:hypothetical protein